MADLQTKGEGSNVNWTSSHEGQWSERAYNTVDTSLILDPDPDLTVEVDIPLNINSDRTRTSKSSVYREWPSRASGVKSRRVMSGKSAENKFTSSPNSAIKTRGRPIKPHESEPFLSVDNISPEKIQAQIEEELLRTQSSKKKRPKTPLINTNQPYTFWTNGQLPKPSPYSSPVPPRSGSRSGARTPASMIFISPAQSPKKMNHHIKSPFKHSVNRPDTYDDGLDTPSAGIKERTAMAVYQIGRILSREKPEQNRKSRGKLLKGKLKPLKPVSVNGPSINQCRGIVAETRTYDEPPSRTLARRRELVQTIPNVHEYLYDRPRTVESIHRTSEASSVDENRDPAKDGESDRGLDTERSEGRPGSEARPESEVRPGSEAVPAPPASMATMYKSAEPPEKSPTPGLLVIDVQNPEKEKTNMTHISKDYTLITTTVSTKLDVLSEKSLSDLSIERQPSASSIAGKNRPMTAGSGRSPSPEKSSLSNRPNTAGDRSKSVRFADDSSERSSDTRNTELAEHSKSTGKEGEESEGMKEKNKMQGKVSCKSESDEVIHRKNDEDDDRNDNQRQNSGKKSGTEITGSTKTENKRSSSEKDSKVDQSNGERGKKQSLHCKETSDAAMDNDSKVNHSDLNMEKLNLDYLKHTAYKSSESSISSIREATVKSSSCRRSSCSANEKPNVLSVGSVIHGSQVHHYIGPESPHRSRSPSPSRSPSRRSNCPVRQCSSPLHVKRESFSVNSQKNSLVRPSSAHKSGRNPRQKTRSSRSSSLQSDSSEVLTARKSKVYFEGERPPHESLFVEKKSESGVDVALREDRALTFEEIEKELQALQEDIKHNRGAEDNRKIVISDEEDDTNDDSTAIEIISLPTHETSSEDEQSNVETETFREGVSVMEYSDLLDVYRRKCMEVSEVCGEMSSTLTTPRKPHNTTAITKGRSSRLASRRNSFHYGDSPQKDTDSSLYSKDDTYKLIHTASQSSVLTTDSGCSMGSVETLKDEISNEKKPVHNIQETSNEKKPVHNIQGQDVSNRVEVSTEKDEAGTEKSLLEFVCDQLPPVEKVPDAENERNDNVVNNDLKIVAEPKKLSKSKTAKPIPPVTAPFPPLCFTINARPPPRYIYFFAYGPNMNPYRLSTYVCRQIDRRFWGLLFGFNLVFNKKGCDPEAGGFANIEFNPFCSTEGCVYQITPEELGMLDKFVGYPEHYEHLMLPVWMMNSKDPDQFGVAQWCVPAVTYIAQDKWIQKNDVKLDSEYSLSQCVKSSDLVTPNYRDHLVNLCVPENNPQQMVA